MDLDRCECGHLVREHLWEDGWPCAECDCTALSMPEDDD